MQPLVEVTRGGIVECTHYGSIAVCDAEGDLLGAVGDPEHVVFWRSSAKPIQALTVVQSGAADRFNFTDKELAVCCASHCGSAEHVATVLGILDKIGLGEEALQCGTHMPGDAAERDRLIRANLPPGPAHNNCSGKHAGKLAATVALGADPGSYLSLDHPVQQSILRNMSALCGVPKEQFHIGVDGCGAPVHGTSLRAMATAFARLCRPEQMPREIREAAPRIIAAMGREPVMVSGKGSFNSDLLAAYAGKMVAKGGAEGLFVVGLTPNGLGFATRTVDGSHRGQSTVVLSVLERLGKVDEGVRRNLAGHFEQTVRNCHGADIGQIRAAEFSIAL